jgi:hypothetical protein
MGLRNTKIRDQGLLKREALDYKQGVWVSLKYSGTLLKDRNTFYEMHV